MKTTNNYAEALWDHIQTLPINSIERNMGHVIKSLLEKQEVPDYELGCRHALDTLKIWMPELCLSLGIGIDLSWFDGKEERV